jgi:Kef-type K+ transport system membrane component KefB
MSVTLLIAVIFSLGYLGGLLANRVGLPKVSGFVLSGILLSPSVTGIISRDFLDSATVVVDLALAMVAYSLGGHLNFVSIRRHGKSITFMTIGQGLGAYLFVGISSLVFMYFYYPSFSTVDLLSLAILFGALSFSTAPAATVATIHEYKACGTFTSCVLAVVALDDALGLFVFALSVAVVKGLVLGSNPSLASLVEPLVSLLWSLGIGFCAGLAFVWLIKFIEKRDTLVITTVAFFCLSFGLAQQFGLEPLLATMALGITIANIYPGDVPFRFLEKNYETMVFAIFFVLAGAHIEVGLLVDYFPLAILFVMFRMSGKWAGAYVGGTLSKAPRLYSRYMGLALAPQAGIAIGLALYLGRIPLLEQYAAIAINVIIAKTAINEILGPWLLKLALTRTGEVPGEEKAETGSL